MNKGGIGFDNIPQEILSSEILSGSDLAMLASVDTIPNKKNTDSLSLKTEGNILKRPSTGNRASKSLVREGRINGKWTG